MTNNEYHAEASITNSMLKIYRRSPALYEKMYVSRTIEREPPSPEMMLGSLVHCMVGGFPVETEFLPVAGCKIRSGKAWEAGEAEAREKGLTPVLESQVESAKIIAEAVLRSEARAYWESAEAVKEEPIFFTGINELPCKCKPDLLLPMAGLCIDLKTSSDPAQFARQAWDYEYHAQAAMYRDGIKASDHGFDANFIFVVVGNKEPFDVILYEASRRFLSHGWNLYAESAAALARSIADNRWEHPLSLEIQTLDPPYWVKEEL